MKAIFTRTALSCLFVLFFAQLANANRIFDQGSNTTYDLKANDTLTIASGKYTGYINSFNDKAVILVSTTATFSPSYINNGKGKIYNYGTVKVSFYLDFGNDMLIDNYGIFEATADGQLRDRATWINHTNAVVTISGKLQLNGNSTFTNEGTFSTGRDFEINGNSVFTNNSKANIGGDFSVNSTTVLNEGIIAAVGNINLNSAKVFENKNTITTKGNFRLNGGHFENTGNILPEGKVEVNNGSNFINKCRMITNGGFINSATFNNEGLLWVGNTGKNTDLFTNTGTINNSNNATIYSVDFTNWGTVKGNAKLYFEGKTIGGGTFGANGNTTDSLLVFDATRTNPARIFDEGYGTINPNTVFRTMSKPDSMASISGCSNTVQRVVAVAPPAQSLPVHFTFFQASLQKNVPQLTWGAAYETGMRFEIERSYNGTSFTAIATMYSNQTAKYQYNDASVNAGVVYYRIKGYSEDGDIKFTEVKKLQIAAAEQQTVSIYPNPAAGATNLVYTGQKAEKLLIVVRDVAGKLVANKTWQVTAGTNQQQLTEIAAQPAGIYFVELTNTLGVKTVRQLIKQ